MPLKKRLGLVGVWLLAAWAGVLCLAPGRAAAADGAASAAQRVDQQAAASQEPRVAGAPENLAIAWLSPDGPSPGVYARRRVNYMWGAPQRLALPAGAAPRDLQLALGPRGRLWLAWTAEAGRERRLFLAAQPAAEAPLAARMIDDGPTSGGGRRDVDFPALAADENGALLSWQQTAGTGFAIHAVRWDTAGNSVTLGLVSGAASGLSPQILSVAPPCVAWYSIDEIGTRLSIDQWNGAGWSTSPLFALTEPLPPGEQILLRRAGDGLAGAWTAAGQPGVTVGLSSIETGLRAASLTRPAGDGSQPALAAAANGRLTAAWRVLNGSTQRICVARIDGDSTRTLEVSPAAQRFAASPDLADGGDWSGVTWVNAAADGGDGHVYFSEIDWSIH